MDLARLWTGAELRRRWRRQLALAILVAFIGGVVLTCVAAARRTESSPSRYLETQAIPEFETSIDTDSAAVPGIVSEIERGSGVRAVGLWNGLYAAPDRDDLLPGQDFLLVAPLDDDFSRDVARPVVLAGRMPDPNAVDEVVVNERAANTLGLEVGEHTKLRSLSTDEGQYLQSGEFDKITFAGPTPTAHVVGIIRGQFDVQGVGFAPHYYLTSRAFAERYGEEIFGYGTQAEVDTEAGADLGAVEAAIENALRGKTENIDVRDVASGFASVRDAARVQAIALLLVSLVALVAGVFAASQIIGRSVRDQGTDLETLRDLGVTRPGWARLSAASQLPAALLAAALTIVAAWIASRWFPTGVPRRVEVDAGAQFDATVLLIGAALTVAGMVGCAAASAWWYRPLASRPAPATRRNLVERATTALAPPTAAGVRWAIGSRQGGSTRAGLVGALVGVIGVLAAVMYSSGLDHVVSTPDAYGWSFDADAGGGDSPEAVAALRDRVLEQDVVDDVAIATVISRVTVDGELMQGWAYEDVRGHIGPSVVTGRAPAGDDEVLLGTKTAEQLGADIGDTVLARGADGADVALEVVGTGLFSSLDSDDFTVGMVATPATLNGLDTSEPLRTVVFNWVPGTDAATAIEQLREADLFSTGPVPTSDVANLRAVENYPRWLAVFLGLLGVLACTHALLVSTRRRRHEAGVLRALGFSQRQVRHAVGTQGATIGFIAVAVGVPLGIAIGRWVWRVHADAIDIGNVVPARTGLTIAAAVLAVALIVGIAVAASRRATSARLSEALRVE